MCERVIVKTKSGGDLRLRIHRVLLSGSCLESSKWYCAELEEFPCNSTHDTQDRPWLCRTRYCWRTIHIHMLHAVVGCRRHRPLTALLLKLEVIIIVPCLSSKCLRPIHTTIRELVSIVREGRRAPGIGEARVIQGVAVPCGSHGRLGGVAVPGTLASLVRIRADHLVAGRSRKG